MLKADVLNDNHHGGPRERAPPRLLSDNNFITFY